MESPRGPLEPIVRQLCDEHGGLRAAARALKISAPYLSRIVNGKKVHPSDEVLKKLGIRKEVTYVRE